MKQEVRERILRDGSILNPLDEDSVRSAVRCYVCPGCGYVELQAAEPYKFK